MNEQLYAGCLAWLYDFQTLIAGVLALGAGALAYLAGVHQANVSRAVAKQQIESATNMQEIERRDEAEKMVNTAANIISQIQFEGATLQRFMEIALVEFDRLPAMKAAGKKPEATNITYRVDKIERLLALVWQRLEPIPVAISGPVGRLTVWLDDLTMRCADFRTTLESGGHMPAEIWKQELAEIVAGFDQLNDAIIAYFGEPSVDPVDTLEKYQDTRLAYVKEYGSQLHSNSA